MSIKTTTARFGVAGAVAAALVVAPLVATTATAAETTTPGFVHGFQLVLEDLETEVAQNTGVITPTTAVYGLVEGTTWETQPTIVAPAGPLDPTAQIFISPRGTENDVTTWHAQAPIGIVSGGIWLPNISFNQLIVAGPGSPSSIDAVIAAGGQYSVGVAFTSNNQLTVVDNGLFFNHVTVEAGTGNYTYEIPTTPGGGTPTEPVPPVSDGDDLTEGNTGGITASVSGTTVTLGLGGTAADGATVHVWVYPGGSLLGSPTVASGQASASIASLGAGTHKIAVSNADDELLGWAEITLTESQVLEWNLGAEVIEDDDTEPPVDGPLVLEHVDAATATIGNPEIVDGQSRSTGELGRFRVDDQRAASRPGWTLTTNVEAFALAGAPDIPNSRLGLEPVKVSGPDALLLGATQVAPNAEYASTFASLPSGNHGETVLNANLTFLAPAGAPAGTYTSKLTVTLVSN